MLQDARTLLEFSRTKLNLANDAHRKRRRETRRRHLVDARTLLELARTLDWLGAPMAEVEAAYDRAISLIPQERGFVREPEQSRAQRRKRGSDRIAQ